jgi:excisionase family DNA binding protein
MDAAMIDGVQERWVSATEAARMLGRSTRTLRRYTQEGVLPDVRSGSGRRVFKIGDIEALRVTLSGADRRRSGTVTYARVTPGPDAEELLAAQQQRLVNATGQDEVLAGFSDIASGLNDRRPGLRDALAEVVRSDARTLLAVHRDRIGLFGARLVEYQLGLLGVRVDYLDSDEEDQRTPDELPAELDEAVSQLAGRLYPDLRHLVRSVGLEFGECV